jgi:hypothetical protein
MRGLFSATPAYGTIFSDPEVLETTVAAAAGHEVNMIATVGSSLTDPNADGARAAEENGARLSPADVVEEITEGRVVARG